MPKSPTREDCEKWLRQYGGPLPAMAVIEAKDHAELLRHHLRALAVVEETEELWQAGLPCKLRDKVRCFREGVDE